MTRLVLTNVNLLDGENPPVPLSTIVVDGDRISDVVRGGPVAARESDKVLDLSGHTVMPGMTLGHFHAAYVEVGSTQVPFGLENQPGYTAMAAAKNVETALSYGFTGVVGAGATNDLDPALVQAVADGLVNGPRIVPCSREMSTTGHSNDWTPWWWDSRAIGATRVLDGAEQFRQGVREEIKHGARMIKLYLTGGHGVYSPKEQMEMTEDELRAAVETAHSRGARARAHIANKHAIMLALEVGLDVIDHADGMDDEAISAIVEANVPVVPGAYFPQRILGILEQEGRYERAAAMREDVEKDNDALRKAARAGVKLCLGDDYGAAILQHGQYAEEMLSYVKNVGLTPLEVIKMATVNGAELQGGIGAEAGKIDAGRRADLVVLTSDPSVELSILGDRNNIAAVILDGQVKVGALPTS
ncbi:amidohydrolase family protein [Rhodococcus sp. NPDC127530]|uniref:amidohydrolase family protein n=1 Tax=unclassified Rhodococcus (in: high G+C Gram-positive bacteria) TaxID=192944 RepID=UPI00363C7CA0